MRRRAKPILPPFRSCGQCTSAGYRVIVRNGERVATRCLCWKMWRNPNPQPIGGDSKQRAAGESEAA